jgi:hypothetical protein
VTEVVGANAPLGHLLDDLPELCKTVACRLDRRSVGIGRLIGSPSMIGEGTLPAALSKPFLLKITLMIGLRLLLGMPQAQPRPIAPLKGVARIRAFNLPALHGCHSFTCPG